MNGPLREIKFGQIHRRSGARRRFIIAQFADDAWDSGRNGDAHVATEAAGVDSHAWRYKVQLGDGVWSAFRPIDVAPSATDDAIRAAAVRHFGGRRR
jgi:hypothetical protein